MDWEDAAPQTDVLVPGRTAVVPNRLRLAVLSGPDQGREMVLERGTYLVGKAPGCALVLTDPGVSRQHLELEVHANGIRVRDLGSTNGSFFGGARFAEVTVGAGAGLTLGATELKLTPVALTGALLPSSADRFGGLLGTSLRMREVFAMLERVAPAEVGVLIEGETGTGKELCAEALHAASPRARGPFVICDLAGVSRSLIE